jgi:uncharacterized protein
VIATTTKREIINRTQDFVRQAQAGDTGHDWWHIYRVYKLAQRIAEREQTNLFIVELAALLHDIADWKFSNDDAASSRIAKDWLIKQGLAEQDITKITQVIDQVSFKGAGVETSPDTLEGQIVQDADRLDAMGAIGIARCFTYGGYKGRILHDPDIKPILHSSAEDYKTRHSTTLNHFYEKLLLLKDRLNTKTGREIGQKRHCVLKEYLESFLIEWEAND